MVHGAVADPVDQPITDDVIQPFQLDRSGLRGRLVRLGASVDAIIRRHAYPPQVASLLAEALALASALAGTLKYDGVFTLQARGDGPLSMLVADITSTGKLRGCAHFDAIRLAASAEERPPLMQLTGNGYLAFTVDPTDGAERYQGIVELTGPTLADCVTHYFRQSEQLVTGVLAAASSVTGGWRAGALILQRLAEGGANLAPSMAEEDDWRRTMLLMRTTTHDELTRPDPSPHVLLHRLFHEEEVRVYTPAGLHDGCRCTRERVELVLCAMPPEDVADMIVDGAITAECQFCSVAYRFPADEVAQLRAAYSQSSDSEG